MAGCGFCPAISRTGWQAIDRIVRVAGHRF
jgi:hypothetical protein